MKLMKPLRKQKGLPPKVKIGGSSWKPLGPSENRQRPVKTSRTLQTDRILLDCGEKYPENIQETIRKISMISMKDELLSL